MMGCLQRGTVGGQIVAAVCICVFIYLSIYFSFFFLMEHVTGQVDGAGR